MEKESSSEVASWVVKFEDKPNRRTVLFPDLFEAKQEGTITFMLSSKGSGEDAVFSNQKVKVTAQTTDLDFVKTKSHTPDQVSPYSHIHFLGDFIERSDIVIELYDNYGTVIESISGPEMSSKISDATLKINSASLVGHSFRILQTGLLSKISMSFSEELISFSLPDYHGRLINLKVDLLDGSSSDL